MNRRKRAMMLMGASPLNFTQATYKGKAVYGVTWDKSATSTLTRTNASVGMVAAAGVDAGVVTNDFDSAEIYSEFTEKTDADGNVFIRIPKFYIRKTDSPTLKTWQICKQRMPGSYLPWCFWDFTNGVALDYVDVGKYPASLSGANKLESLANKYPLINKNIVEFRGYAEANGAGYQQLDLHTNDALQVLMTVEFATLDMQSVMYGFISGRFVDTERAVIAESGTNRIVVPNATASQYRVGQPIGIGSTRGGNQRFYGRDITAINDYDASNKSIVFDGDPVNISIDDRLYNVGWKSGFSAGIAASSGSLTSNSDGKWPCVYRGIENPYANIWQFIDGVNINDRQAWVCTNPAQYASNVFAFPYEQLSYVNANANNYVKYMGYDAAHPFAEFPVEVQAASNQYYSDYYYQDTGQRIARVGAFWSSGTYFGPWCWNLNEDSTLAYVNIGGRLCKKALSA